MDPIDNYPKRFDQQYKDYEFLPCVLYSTQFEGEHHKKYKIGRFKGNRHRTNKCRNIIAQFIQNPPRFV